ncbi:MAG: AtpZ/AtpI family protein [Peptococcaceae bacterium]|nr:AtpZ/AtpI family protein [Peptococcaceae bacterium]
MEKKPLSWIHYTAIGTGISATLAGLVVGGYFLGSFLDRRFDSDPLWTLLTIFVALGLGVAYLGFMIWRFLKTNSPTKPSQTESDDHET